MPVSLFNYQVKIFDRLAGKVKGQRLGGPEAGRPEDRWRLEAKKIVVFGIRASYLKPVQWN